jgi:hypothetical protein
VRVEKYPPTGGHQSDPGPGGPDEHPEGRVCGPCLQEQGTEGEAGAGTAQEGGSDGEGHPKDEPHTDPDRAGGALERRIGGGGRLPKERLAARRTAAGRVPEELRVPHQEEVPEREAAEHGLRRGTENPPRGNGERKSRRRPDPLLRNGGDPREAVLQVPSFRPHGEGVQEQGAVLQVRERGPPEERVRGGGQEVPELHQGQEGANEPLRDGQEVPRTPEEDAAEGEQNREDLNGTGEYSHNARDKLVVFQVNLGKGREATDLLQKTAEEQKADVVFIQESYCYMPTWVGWTKYGGGRTDKIATLVRTGRRSIELTQFTGPTTRTVVIEGARGDIAFFNVYVPPKDPLEGTLTVLEELLASRKGKPTIIAGDLNGRHPAFGGEEEDVRGRQIIDLVGAANLVVENDRDSIPTFETANGKSWIDITLSRDTTVESWAVGEEETLSDHRSIFFSVDIGEAGNDQPKERKRIMMVHQADWQLFRDAAIKGKGAIFEEDSAEDMASALQGLAMRACKASIPCGIRRERKGAKLRRIRTGVRKARSQMQGERNQERRAELRENFKKERAAYKMAIKEAKIEALRKALAQGSPEDPWGLAYKLVTSKKRGAATPWTTIQDSEGNWAGNRTETAMALIRKYFPEDDPGADTAENRETRAKRPEWSDDQAREITQQELRRTI